MRCLVILAHPVPGSLSHQNAEVAVARLRQRGHEVVFRDLCADGFSPSLTTAERVSYHDNYDISDVAEHVAQLQDAEGLVLAFPTWWFGYPAILKGWFDRVWAPGVAFNHAGDLGPIQPRLTRLRHVMAVTTLGAPFWVDRIVMRQPVKRITKTAILAACAPRSRLDFLSLYSSETATGDRIRGFHDRIESRVSRWQ